MRDDDSPRKSTDDEKIIKQAKREFKRCEEWEAGARTHFVMDIKFGNGDQYNKYQWPTDISKSRDLEEKPMLTINKTQVHCDQIVNDARQNKMGIEVRPVGGNASKDAALVYEGIVRHIEYVSRAQAAYDTATWFQVYGGWGYTRLHVDYIDDNSFDQDIRIKRVPNPLNVYLDPDIQNYDGSDARFAFVFNDISRDEAKEKYPEYVDDWVNGALGTDPWDTKDHVRECEYFRVGKKSDKLLRLQDGTSIRKSAVPKQYLDQIMEMVADSRDIRVADVEWFMIVGDKIVDRKPWLGKYIPIARCIGKETVIDGVMDRKGHVRCLLDPQQMYNYQASGSVEFVASQTRTPWVAPIRAIEGYVDVWRTANTNNYSVLPYNDMDDNGHPIAPPKRTEPPVSSQGHIDGMRAAESQMMMASGQYQAVMGAPSNETSGKAINARQRQGDNATYHFIDHSAQMVGHLGRMIVDLIPKVYDTPRVIKILGLDGMQMSVSVDPTAPDAVKQVQDPDKPDFDAQQVAMIFNPTVGEYDVMADVGPSYETSRQEAFNAFSQIIAQNKEAFTIVGDLWADAADFPGSEEMAKRLKRMLPPAAAGGPSKEMQALQAHVQQAAQAGQQQIEQLHAELQKRDQELAIAKAKLSDRGEDAGLERYRAETERMNVLAKTDPAAFKPLIRELISEVMGEPIIPVMAEHAAAEQAMMPQEPDMDNAGAAENEAVDGQ